MNARIRLILAAAAIGLAGCAAGPRLHQSQATLCDAAADIPSTRPEGKAAVPLRELKPSVSLGSGLGPLSGAPPVEAVQLYAQARIAMLDQQRGAAINYLEKAIAIDPLSYELHSTLGKLYLTPTTDFSDRSLRVLERAAVLEPDHLDLHTDLGRQYIAKGDVTSALKHLRLARLTHEYCTNPGGASVAEFFLATLLRNQGYDLAALEVYQQLSAHLKIMGGSARVRPEAGPLLEHVDAIDGEIAELLVRTGQFPEAAAAFGTQVSRFPANFELRLRQVHLLLAMRRTDDAMNAAEEAAVHFHADAASIALLNEACVAAGRKETAAGVLARLHEMHPADQAILYALVDVLRGEKQTAEAAKLLKESASKYPRDVGIIRRQFDIVLAASGLIKTAELLIEATAKSPDLALELEPLWSNLSRPSALGRLRYSDVSLIPISPEAETSKWYWVARLAQEAHRDDVAAEALDRATSDKTGPGSGSAFLERVERLWDRADLDVPEKQKETDDLCSRAVRAGGEGLGEEVQALALLRQNEPVAAIALLDRALESEAGKHSPTLALRKAETLRKTGNDSAADSVLWKLVSDYPLLSEAYLNLYLSSLRRDLENQAERVVTTWLSADPESVTARRIQAIQDQRSGRGGAAEALLLRLFKQHPSDPEAVTALAGFYARLHKTEKMIPLLQERHAADPHNFAVSSTLVDLLAAEHRTDDASRVIDSSRDAYISDPDLLYSISGQYARLGQKGASEETLREVLKLDSNYIPAANDLGYLWAERGQHLEEAEILLRKAAMAEPHNVSFLDSMGWVLYKRGRFAEARVFLDQAIGKRSSKDSIPSDPVLLDHRGDLLYRLGEKEAAVVDWQNAADQIAATGEEAADELKQLRTELLEKIRQQQSGEAVIVSPAMENNK